MEPSALPRPADRRRDPRYAALLPVTVRGLELATRNVSRRGMQIACASVHVGLLGRDLEAGRLEIEASLPHGCKLRAGARVVYCSEADDEWLIGLELDRADEGDLQSLEAFVKDLARRGRRPLD